MKSRFVSSFAAVLACLCLWGVAVDQARAAGVANPPPWDVSPQATVRLAGRVYGIYATLTRWYPGTIPEDPLALPTPPYLTFQVTLVPMDGFLFNRAIRTPACTLSQGRIRWRPALESQAVPWLLPVQSVGYGATGADIPAWATGSRVNTVLTFQDGRRRFNVVVRDVVVLESITMITPAP